MFLKNCSSYGTVDVVFVFVILLLLLYIATYAAKLYKSLDKYDKMDAEVDFPNWWQAKVIMARDYISKAQHYLEFEEKQPAIDQLALQENINPEAEKYVKRFIAGVAKKYGYDEMDAVHLIYQVLANTGYLDMRLESTNEIGMFHDPIGYSSTAAAEDKRALQFVKDLINKGINKEDAIEKAAEKFKLRVHYLTRYVDKHIDEAEKFKTGVTVHFFALIITIDLKSFR